jgi:hypothetical protein
MLRGADGRRFISAGPFDDEMPWYYLVIADITYWLKNEPEIYAWMDDNLPHGRMHQKGMTLEFETDEQLTLFVLRWA